MIGDAKITRIYKCKDCECEIAFEELIKDPWRTKCPFCDTETLYLDRAVTSLSLLMDLKRPKTGGMITQENLLRREKETGSHLDPKEKKKMPFWRDKPLNMNVLKNPKYYIESGKI